MTDRERLKRLQSGSAFSNEDINFLLRQAELYQTLTISESSHNHYVKELQQEKRIWKECSENLLRGLKKSIKWYEVAYDRCEKLQEALEFYADEENNYHKIDLTVWEYENLSNVVKDSGEKAREVLEELK